ncbi:hypothetical protein JG688_00011879 [Phytophthora aleatoria]|uniref:Uncharacterized protein n=1 Tax=Phytophthora aleatoria TaxID=2496075 RepID=A0A8J5M504_9STRA|nr:hypothetical protein GQ600_14615 [Phytophthora cactorum]KAG6955443.1 hypothetical protein JG688_00011879 [Phytophthora aleatoria]
MKGPRIALMGDLPREAAGYHERCKPQRFRRTGGCDNGIDQSSTVAFKRGMDHAGIIELIHLGQDIQVPREPETISQEAKRLDCRHGKNQ